MDLYLVTKSDKYYPQSGTWDWRLLTEDEDEARRHYESLDDASDAGVCLIRITRKLDVFTGESTVSYSLLDSR